MGKLVLTCALLLLIAISVNGQETSGGDSLQKASLAAYYSGSVQQQRLYNGTEHTGYSPNIKGHAYYFTREWQNGTVHYDGVLYQDVPVLYDMYKDQVIVRHFSDIFTVGLVSPKVTWFTIPAHRFIRVEALPTENIRTGFYEVLFEGKITALARRTKTMSEYIGNTMEYEFMEHTQYLIKKDSVYHIIRNEGKLLDVLNDQRPAVKQHLRKNRIRFRKTPELAIVKAVEFYETLNR